ncbi:hypothetical protein B0H10DRAFT_2334049 [Mycena sp. CBHHK59/15]|nr:hypothetical protein B0H10DRAFT_2334049 [Mycena sp. CBHHK59/15]
MAKIWPSILAVANMLYSFQLLSDQEIIDMNEAAELWPVLSAKVPRGGADICPTGDLGLIGRGRRYALEGGNSGVLLISARVMRFESPESSTTTHSMGDRIQRLETAVAEAHAEESDSTHPLLREGLLGSSAPLSLHALPAIPPCSVGGHVRRLGRECLRYFAALLSAQGSAGGDRAEFASPFADITESFPFDAGYSSSWDTALCLENLLSLPLLPFRQIQFIVGSIVAKCPTSEIAPTAFMELQAAGSLVRTSPERHT